MNSKSLTRRQPFVVLAACAFATGVAGLAMSQAAEGQSPLDGAFAQLATYDWGQSREAIDALDAAINRAASDASQRGELETRLAAVLSTHASVAAKSWACDRLSRIGSAASVPTLTPLLADAQLSQAARNALVRIAGPAASEALRNTLPTVAGDLKIGVISALALLQDPNAVDPLKHLLISPEPAIASAAAAALGEIGTLGAAQALGEFRRTAPKEVEESITAAWLNGAEHLLKRGQFADAAAIFRVLYRAESSDPLRRAGFRGLLAAEPERTVDLLSQALAGDDDPIRRLAARIIADAPDAPRLDQFISSLKSYPPPGQIAILEAVKWRREATARPALSEVLRGSEPSVRNAALRGLGAIGTAADVTLLAREAAAGPEKDAARQALDDLPGQAVNGEIMAALPAASPDGRVELISALASRRAFEASVIVAEHLTDQNPAVRTCALDALAVLGTNEQVPALIRYLDAVPSEEARESTEKTLNAIAKRARLAVVNELCTGLKRAKIESQMVILRVLGIAGGPAALETLRVIVTQKDSPLRGTALRVMTEWSGVEALPDLLRLAQNPENATWGVLAFRGYVRLCRESPQPVEEKIRRFAESLVIAKTPEQKRLVISALGELQDAGALALLNSCLNQGELQEEVCLAIIGIAGNAENRNTVGLASALRQVINVSPNPEVRKEAQSRLDSLLAKSGGAAQ